MDGFEQTWINKLNGVQKMKFEYIRHVCTNKTRRILKDIFDVEYSSGSNIRQN
jgi:hypothetical protein